MQASMKLAILIGTAYKDHQMCTTGIFYSTLLDKQVAKVVFDTCVINFTTHRANRNQHTVHVPFIVGNSTQSTGSISQVGNPKSTQLRGYERIITQQELKKTDAKSFYMEKVWEADTDMIASGNLGVIKSLDVYRKAKSEEAKRSDLDRDDDFNDLYLITKEELNLEKTERYNQEISLPLKVYIYSHTQLKMLINKIPKKGCCILHIDSTGSVVRPLKDEYKTV